MEGTWKLTAAWYSSIFHLVPVVTLHTLAEKTAGVGGAVSRTGTAASASTCTHHRGKTNRTNWWSELIMLMAKGPQKCRQFWTK